MVSDLGADQRRARALNALVLWFLLGIVGLVMVTLTAPEDERAWGDERLPLALAGIGAGLILSYTLSRQGALPAATVISQVTLNVTLLILLAGFGSLGPVLAFVPLVVLSVAILWSRHAAVWLTLAWSVVYLITALAEQGGFEPLLLRNRQAFPAAVSIWLGLLGFGLTGVLAWSWAASAPRGSETRGSSTDPRTPEAGRAIPSQSEPRPSESKVEEQQGTPEAPESQPQQRPALPIVPLFHGTIVLAVSGELDAALGEQLLTDLFHGIVEHDAHFVFLDISRVPVIHETAACSLARVVAGARLMGAEVALVGIGSRLASRLVELDVNLRGATTHVDMEAALRYALYRLGRISRPRLTAGSPVNPSTRQLESGSTTES
jgi:anti-anti-sigma regulatory factor